MPARGSSARTVVRGEQMNPVLSNVPASMTFGKGRRGCRLVRRRGLNTGIYVYDEDVWCTTLTHRGPQEEEGYERRRPPRSQRRARRRAHRSGSASSAADERRRKHNYDARRSRAAVHAGADDGLCSLRVSERPPPVTAVPQRGKSQFAVHTVWRPLARSYVCRC